MPDFEREKYLHNIKTEAWETFRRGLQRGVDAPQLFAHATEVYERELRSRTSLEGIEEFFRAVSTARDLAYEVVEELDPDRPMTARIRMLIAELDKALGPDLVREADPSGKVLKSLPYDERKRILEAAGLPMVEDEAGSLFEKTRKRDEAAERLSDYLTQLGVDPDEIFEGDPRTTAQILTDVVLNPGDPDIPGRHAARKEEDR